MIPVICPRSFPIGRQRIGGSCGPGIRLYGRAYYGDLTPDGLFRPRQDAMSAVVAVLREFAVDPVNKAAEYGNRTGRCCFCDLPLTDPPSVELWFGPICKKNRGLS
jgi:hypothetical protein